MTRPRFVHVADDHTLLILNRRGNNRLDTSPTRQLITSNMLISTDSQLPDHSARRVSPIRPNLVSTADRLNKPLETKRSAACPGSFLISRIYRTHSSASTSAGSVISTRNARLLLKCRQRLSRRRNPPLLGRCDSEPNKPPQPQTEPVGRASPLVSRGILNDKFRPAVYREDHR